MGVNFTVKQLLSSFVSTINHFEKLFFLYIANQIQKASSIIIIGAIEGPNILN